MTTTEDLEGQLADLRDRLAAAENALADAREERDEANAWAGELQERLDTILDRHTPYDPPLDGVCEACDEYAPCTTRRTALGEDTTGEGKP